MFWNRKPKPEPTPEPPRTIEFRPDDNMFKRAENIWSALGFVNDRFGVVPQIAGYLSMYRDWDARQAMPSPSPAVTRGLSENGNG